MMRTRNIVAAAITAIAAATALATSCAWAWAPAALSSTAPGAQNSSPPTGSVSGVRSPMEAASTLNLMIDASDTTAGLASAQASIGGNTESVSLCPASMVGKCPEAVVNVPLSVNVGGAGSHVLLVTVTDTAGNTTTLVDQTIEVLAPEPPGSNTVTIGIGNAGPPNGGPPEPPETGGKGEKGGRGEVSGSSFSTLCRSPLLVMSLTSKPLRYAKVKNLRMPVLRARRNYTYRGRLTCLLGARRVSAPTGTVVDVFYKIGRHPARRAGRGTTIVHKGSLRAILGYSYASARTIVFRYGRINSEFVQVKIPIEVAPAHRSHRRRRR